MKKFVGILILLGSFSMSAFASKTLMTCIDNEENNYKDLVIKEKKNKFYYVLGKKNIYNKYEKSTFALSKDFERSTDDKIFYSIKGNEKYLTLEVKKDYYDGVSVYFYNDIGEDYQLYFRDCFVGKARFEKKIVVPLSHLGRRIGKAFDYLDDAM